MSREEAIKYISYVEGILSANDIQDINRLNVYMLDCLKKAIELLESEPPAGEFDWELVNEKTQDDIISITMDFVHNRASSGQIADRIAKRCDAVKDIYQAKIDRLEAENKQYYEDYKIQVNAICELQDRIDRLEAENKELKRVGPAIRLAKEIDEKEERIDRLESQLSKQIKDYSGLVDKFDRCRGVLAWVVEILGENPNAGCVDEPWHEALMQTIYDKLPQFQAELKAKDKALQSIVDICFTRESKCYEMPCPCKELAEKALKEGDK